MPSAGFAEDRRPRPVRGSQPLLMRRRWLADWVRIPKNRGSPPSVGGVRGDPRDSGTGNGTAASVRVPPGFWGAAVARAAPSNLSIDGDGKRTFLAATRSRSRAYTKDLPQRARFATLTKGTTILLQQRPRPAQGFSHSDPETHPATEPVPRTFAERDASPFRSAVPGGRPRLKGHFLTLSPDRPRRCRTHST